MGKYKEMGSAALTRKKNIRSDGAIKESAVRDYLENHLTLIGISLKYDASAGQVRKWVALAQNQGYAALYRREHSKYPPEEMGRPKKKLPETELEKLQYEVARLRAENDLLKKVKALVEEREVRLRAIGRKPSGN